MLAISRSKVNKRSMNGLKRTALIMPSSSDLGFEMIGKLAGFTDFVTFSISSSFIQFFGKALLPTICPSLINSSDQFLSLSNFMDRAQPVSNPTRS
jgi:hypothetical protein